MEIRNIEQYRQSLQTPQDKAGSGYAAFYDTSDTFKPGMEDDKSISDIKIATAKLFEKNIHKTYKSNITEYAWEIRGNSPVCVADDQKVVMGNEFSDVKALAPDNGNLLWNSNIKGKIKEGKDGTLFVWGGESGKSITALDPKDGKKLWIEKFKSQVRILDITDDGTLFIQAPSEGRVIALNPVTREVKGECKVTGDPVIGKNGMVFCGGSNQNNITAYDFKTGEKKWEISNDGASGGPPVIGKDGTVFIDTGYGYHDLPKHLMALDPDTGKQKWSIDIKSGGQIDIGPDGTVYYQDSGEYSGNGTFYAIDTDTGEKKWEIENMLFKNGINFLSDGTIIGASEYELFAIDPDKGRMRFSRISNSIIVYPPLAGRNGEIYFGTGEPKNYCIRDFVVPSAKLEKTLRENESTLKEDPHITGGNGFIDIGGVRLKVNE